MLLKSEGDRNRRSNVRLISNESEIKDSSFPKRGRASPLGPVWAWSHMAAKWAFLMPVSGKMALFQNLFISKNAIKCQIKPFWHFLCTERNFYGIFSSCGLGNPTWRNAKKPFGRGGENHFKNCTRPLPHFSRTYSYFRKVGAIGIYKRTPGTECKSTLFR